MNRPRWARTNSTGAQVPMGFAVAGVLPGSSLRPPAMLARGRMQPPSGACSQVSLVALVGRAAKRSVRAWRRGSCAFKTSRARRAGAEQVQAIRVEAFVELSRHARQCGVQQGFVEPDAFQFAIVISGRRDACAGIPRPRAVCAPPGAGTKLDAATTREHGQHWSSPGLDRCEDRARRCGGSPSSLSGILRRCGRPAVGVASKRRSGRTQRGSGVVTGAACTMKRLCLTSSTCVAGAARVSVIAWTGLRSRSFEQCAQVVRQRMVRVAMDELVQAGAGVVGVAGLGQFADALQPRVAHFRTVGGCWRNVFGECLLARCDACPRRAAAASALLAPAAWFRVSPWPSPQALATCALGRGGRGWSSRAAVSGSSNTTGGSGGGGAAARDAAPFACGRPRAGRKVCLIRCGSMAGHCACSSFRARCHGTVRA